MIIYRVERRFCTQREDVRTVDWSSWEDRPKEVFTPSWNKEPRSPYGWVGCDNSDATYEFLDRHGIGIGNFSHISGNSGKPNRPAPANEPSLMHNACLHFGVEEIAYLPKNWHKEFYFGFETEGHFYKWFDEEDFETLRNKGYYLALYEVDDNSVIKGRTQLVFKRSQATQVDFILF